MKRPNNPDQLLIDWGNTPAPKHAAKVSKVTSGDTPRAPTHQTLVQVLPWDFRTTFPQPTDEAIEAGVLDESDREPENLNSLHENYAKQCLATLMASDKVMDARRQGIDPGTGKPPRTHAARERLRKYLGEEPGRLEHTFEVLIETYGNAFGQDAADAFRKAIRAWHAGIEVKIETPPKLPAATQPEKQRRISARLPVPRPLSAAVAAGNFGQDERGRPIRPGPCEVREITETHAEKLIDANEDERRAGIKKYAEDFGPRPAAQLEAYIRRQREERSR